MVKSALASALSGETIVARLKALALYTDVPGEMTRLTLSPAHKLAADHVLQLFRAAGMSANIDHLGSVVGRYGSDRKNARTLLVGSHIDTVPNGGIYDGSLGVFVGLAVVEELARTGKRLPFDIEVIAFSDEEGVRFPTTLTSSRALAGTFDSATLEDKDCAGITRRRALQDFGCDPDRWEELRRDPEKLLGYLEVHIEQGLALEAHLEAVGSVSGIAGVSRGKITITGKAGHAGTTPMDVRKDALTAAAEIILAIEKLARTTDDLVATVGVLDIQGGAVNAIPSLVSMSYDIRSGEDRTRVRGIAMALGLAKEIAATRECGIDITMTYAAPAAVSDPGLLHSLTQSVLKQGGQGLVIPSGASHDAMSFRTVCPQAMLFVRSKDGLSHHPDEYTTAEDIGIAAQTLYDALLIIAEDEGAR
jgi:allantoate deiminase